MTIRSKVQNICLNQLFLSPANVRKTPATSAEDAELEASIRAHGILQNLIVHPTLIEGQGVYEVNAGGRRLKILQKLAAEGVIAADHKVPCLVEKAKMALETSLMENRVRANMHPADEFLAMAALVDAGQPIETVALRFGVSERLVRQRLRLGKIAPELLEEFRAGKLSLESLMAFTLDPNHEAQLAVWRQLQDQSYVSPYSIKRLLTSNAVPLDSRLGRFVGAEAYEAAGGRIARDLFSEEDEGFMTDAALVRRLATEKLEAKAAELRSHWGWAKAILDPEYGFFSRFGRVHPKSIDLPHDLAEEVRSIESRLSELESLNENEVTEELADEASRLEERRNEIAAVARDRAFFTEQDREQAGCIVTIGHNGDFCIHRGLVEVPLHGSGTPDEEGDDDSRTSGGHQSRGARAPSREQLVRKECGYSQILVDDLKAHRLQIARAHLAGDFGVAFDLALYALCTDLFRSLGYRPNPLDLRASETELRSSLNDLAGTHADHLLETRRLSLPLHWLELPPAQAFAALAAIEPEAKQRLFAWCIAATLKPQLSIEDSADPVIEAAIARLAVPFADCWRPTAANYWGRAKKGHGLAAAREILGDRWARDHMGDKKPVLAQALEAAFNPEASASCIGLGQAEREAAAGWLPPGMAAAIRDDQESLVETADEGEDETALDVDGLIDGDDDEPETGKDDLPAFLTEDEDEGNARIAVN